MALDRNANEDSIPESVKADIVKRLWQRNTAPENATGKWNTYFSYYTAECKKAIAYRRGEYATVRTHQDVTTIATTLENDHTKGDIMQPLLTLDTQNRSAEAKLQMAEGSLRLVARLLSMVDIGPLPYAVQGRAPLIWDDGQSSLKTVLEHHFQESNTEPKGVKFGEDFNAFNLEQLTGLEIQWTNNLANHLRLMDNDTTLCIFHHSFFLKHQNSPIFPEGLAEETLRTLALLFPRNDRRTRRWLMAICSSTDDTICPDMEILNCERIVGEQRRAEKFKFWRDELLTLNDIFEKPRPTSISQFWYDRRNKAQWYTFWIAVLVLCLTIFFGLIQNIEGALQVYKAYHPTPA